MYQKIAIANKGIALSIKKRLKHVLSAFLFVLCMSQNEFNVNPGFLIYKVF